MSLKLPYVSTLAQLTILLASRYNGGTLALYTSNHTPADGDTLSTYTAIEAAFGGYARITLNAWNAPALDSNNYASSTETVRTFTATGSGLPVSIYGVFVLDVNGALAYAELNPTGAVVLSAAGHSFSYLPIITEKSQF